MESPWCPVVVLTLAVWLCCFAPACADGSYGCLFEDELCRAYEFCVNDGVFGRCQELAVADLNTYDVSSSGLLRLRTLLQKLAHRGLTWQDDITQQVISQELSKLRSHQAASEAPFGSYDIVTGRNGRPGQAELNRNLQRFLKGLQFLPQLQPGVQQKAVSTQNDGISDDSPSDRAPPKSGWKETSIYSLQKGPDQAPITKVISKSGEGRHPKLSAPYKPLSNQLDQLLGGREPPESNGKLRYLGYVRPPPDEIRVDFGSKAPKPNLDGLLFRSGSGQLTAKKPSHVMNDRLMQDMMNHLGGHNFNMDPLMAKDLNHLADVITGVLQEAEVRQPDPEAQPGPGTAMSDQVTDGDREQVAAVESNKVLDTKPNKVLVVKQKVPSRFRQGQQEDSAADKEPVDKHTAIFSKLLNYLDKFDDSPDVQPVTGEKAVGLESIHSRTTQSQSAKKVFSAPAREDSSLRLISGATPDAQQSDSEMVKWMQKPAANDVKIKTQLVHVGLKEFSSRGKDRHFGYIITGSDSLTSDQAMDLMERLTQELKLHAADLTQLSVLGPALTFRVGPNPANVTTADLVQVAVQQKQQLEKETGLKIVEAGVSDRGSLSRIPVVKETRVESGQLVVLSVLCVLFILVVLLVSATFFCVRQRSHLRIKEKLSSLGTDTGNDATATYQELCRQRMAIRASERVERPETLRHSRLNSVSSQFSDGPGAGSPSTRSSTSSWCEEPVPSNMDISTGHMILSYMEDHLKNKNRLQREWEALCLYQAEPATCNVARSEQSVRKNRSDAVLAYDHSRITLKAENNHSGSDYINASPIMDHDPRNPTYIASQGPLPSTVADFWQMVWESGCVVVVMLTPVSENGVKQCHHYWPDEGSDVYHFYEVNLVSEHIWCEDFLVRSFYLKNLHTNETRTVTQFHFLSWMDRGVPNCARTLLDFRRKVNKCYRGRSCPIIVHCSDGAGRSGTYILIDMVLNRMAKGAKEIDIAATLEHLRDQRAGMVHTKEQFEFALTAVAEEVNAILKAMPQ
ncbi:receptor-type tyrosine-protein phosphatase N2 [Corythoichthys intestinalis]|uniref:receptor-type tyrosine-protein phosphatase N2 n=1 Tax=Corythoichthys intestinalis TaxID=161448 RepID=UPI0025A56290|nr:receptor-type tyrosine-protein phosphatase N2 [Corythoichthys intestinalis]